MGLRIMDLAKYFEKDVKLILIKKMLEDINGDFIDPFNSPPNHELKWHTIVKDNKGPLFIYPHPIVGEISKHHHNFFEFVYVYRGTCKMNVDSIIIELKAGDICLFNLQANHSIEVTDIKKDMIFNLLVKPDYFNSVYFRLTYLSNSEYLFDFFLESMLNHCLKDNYILFQYYPDNTYEYLINHLIYEHYHENFHKEELQNFLLSSLLIELSRIYGSNLDASSKKELKNYKITEITDYIYEHYDRISLKDLAKHFNYNTTYLSTIIKKYTGSSFSEMLHTFRFLKACQFLTNTNKNVAEIIEEVGCSNQTWFIQNFKKRYGASPSEYRRRYKK